MQDSDSPMIRRATHRLTLDSEEDERLEEEQEKRREEKRIKKIEKKRRREQAEKDAQQSAMEPIANNEPIQQYKDEGNNKLNEEDSSSGISFKRICEKIKKNYPSVGDKKEVKKKKQKAKERRRERSSSSESEQQESQSERTPKKSKKIEKSRKVEKKVEKKKPEEPKAKAVVKLEDISSKKESLAQEVAIRWWFALPEWIPADFSFELDLEKQGYRCVPQEKFNIEPEISNGLHKAYPVDGFPGIFKSKYKMIDARNKQKCPSLRFFMGMSTDQLTKLLKIALKNQIQQLRNVEFQQSGQKELLAKLQKMLTHIK